MHKITKIVILIISIIAMASIASADVPQIINYQGFLTDDTGEPLTGTYDITFSICSDSAGGICSWTEEHTGVQVTDGLFSVIMGSVAPLILNVFSTEERWLSLEVGTEHLPSFQMMSVPYAHHAGVADSAKTVEDNSITSHKIVNGTIEFNDFGSNGATDGDVVTYNGSQWMAGDCLPYGVIVMWSGTLASIPDGWVLRDGSYGTPNLIDRFVYGVGSGETPGASGGNPTHSHTVDPPSTNTYSSSQSVNVVTGAGVYVSRDTHNHQLNISVFNSGDGSSLPPYFKLAFIMKL